MDKFLTRLSEITGIPDLAYNDDGVLEIPVDSDTLLEIRRVSDSAAELYSVTDLKVDLTDTHILGVLLGINYLGAGVGSARLGLEDNSVVLSERLELPIVDGRILMERVEEFLQRVKYWSSSSVTDFFKPPVHISFDHSFIRA